MLLALACGGAARRPSDPSAASNSDEADDRTCGFGLYERGRVAREGSLSLARSDNAKLVTRLTEEYLALVVESYPEKATELGIYSQDDRLTDLTRGAESRRLAAWRMFEEKLEQTAQAFETYLHGSFDSDHVAPGTAVDLRLLRGALNERRLKREVLNPLARMPSVYTAPMNALFLMTARDYAPAPQRAKSILARVLQISNVVAAGKANLKDPPRSWVQIGLDSAKSAGKFFDGQRSFLVQALPAEAKEIDAALKAAKAAYVDYARFLQAMLPKAKPDFAIGAEAFSKLLEAEYGLTEPLSVTKARGRQVFDRTQAEMSALAKQIDPKAKDVASVIAALKLKHPKAEDLLKAYSDETARARAFLVAKDAIAMPEGDDLSIIDTPVFQRGTVQAAYDQPPPFGDVSKGFFFVTPVDPKWPAKEQESWLRENDHGDIVDTAVHEAYPGHHLQLSFARKHKSVIRKVQDAAIFSEGWALYSEELMNELGYYTPEERMLQLEWTLVRAARVLIDIGLQTEGMTEKQAADLLVNEVHLERKLAENEIRRYTQDPTQPLAYLTGREQLFELRGKYKARQGGSYSLKAWHSEVLSHGTIPPAYIAAEMRL